MSNAAIRRDADSTFEILRHGREVLRAEGAAVVALAQRLDDTFCQAVDLLLGCQGCVIVTGMGKAGLVGQKLTATLASTGTRSHFLHPAEAFHGDLGRVGADDVVIVLSQSGETGEVVQILPALQEFGVPIIAITGAADCSLAKAAKVTLCLGKLKEAGPNGLAPSTSTTAMIALGDALALVVSQLRGFQPQDFARFHPGGSLGRKLAKVEEVMRPLDQCRLANQNQHVREVFINAGQRQRRAGAVMLTDDQGRLRGIFTDSDLARLLEGRRDESIDRPIAEVMTANPTTILAGQRLSAAVRLLAGKKISELPVVDANGQPVGMIDITDVVSLTPTDDAASGTSGPNLPAETPDATPESEPTIVPFSNQTPKE